MQRSNMNLSVVFVMLITFTMCIMCKSLELTAKELDKQRLPFQFPCNSIKFTVQYRNRDPFYTLKKETIINGFFENISLPPDQINRFTVESIVESENCSLHIGINPVELYDAGTYISFAHDIEGTIKKNRIGLQVEYRPGKASCKLSDDYIVGKWVTLDCKVSAWSLLGQIVCYQNGERMPPKTSPIKNDDDLEQTILVKNTLPVFCCASALEQTKDICECTDFKWDFEKNMRTLIDPCGSTTPAQNQIDISEPASTPSNPTCVSTEAVYTGIKINPCNVSVENVVLRIFGWTIIILIFPVAVVVWVFVLLRA